MEILKRIWKDIQHGENIDLYAGVLLALVTVIVSLLGVVTGGLVASLTLTILGLLAISNLVNRHRIEELSKRFGVSNTPFLRSRKDLAKLPESAKEAKDILIIACSASAVLLDTQFFINRIKQGTRIRLAVINPDDNAMIEILSRADIISAQAEIADMRTAAGLIERIRAQTSSTDLFEVRVFNYIPTLSLVMIDGHLPTGHIIVEMYPYQVDPGQRPHFLVTAKEHPNWYSYFRDIGEAIWQDAKLSSLHLSLNQEKEGQLANI